MSVDLSRGTFTVVITDGDAEWGELCQGVAVATGGYWRYNNGDDDYDGPDSNDGYSCNWQFGPGYTEASHPGLHALLRRSGLLDESWSAEDSKRVAEELAVLLPALERLDESDKAAGEEKPYWLCEIAGWFIDGGQ